MRSGFQLQFVVNPALGKSPAHCCSGLKRLAGVARKHQKTRAKIQLHSLRLQENFVAHRDVDFTTQAEHWPLAAFVGAENSKWRASLSPLSMLLEILVSCYPQTRTLYP